MFGGMEGDAQVLSRAIAEFGVLRVYAEAHIGYRGPTNIVSKNASATAFFRDDFTINSLNLTDQPGSFTFSLRIDGGLTATPGVGEKTAYSNPSTASAGLGVSVNRSIVIRNSTESIWADGTTHNQGETFLNELEVFTVPFVYGKRFELTVELFAGAQAVSDTGAVCISNLEHTLEWGGISSVNDSGNNPIGDYSILTASGTDFSQAIPEPSSALLLLASASLLGLRRRRAALAAPGV